MRLAEGIVVESEPTFGELKFAKMRRERYKQNEDGTLSKEVTGRTYDLKCKAQGGTISVTLPVGAGEKTFEYNAVVELVNPIVNTVATAGYGSNASASWYIKADDIVLKKSLRVETSPQHQQNKKQG